MNFVTFNQDYSHLAVSTSRGYRIYTTDPFSKCFETKYGDIALLEMLFSTSLVALILSPRRLQIKNTKVRFVSTHDLVLNSCSGDEHLLSLDQSCYYHSRANQTCILQKNSTICELTFPTTVLAVRMNRKRLVVVLEDQIYLYDISNMKLLYTIETSPNPTGTRSSLGRSVCHAPLMHRSNLHPVSILRKLLPSLPSPSKGSAFFVRTTLTCSTWRNTYSSNQRRRTSF